jgi:hypothetical protein
MKPLKHGIINFTLKSNRSFIYILLFLNIGAADHKILPITEQSSLICEKKGIMNGM